MGTRLSVAQQRWSPELEPDDAIPLLERPRFLAIECAVLEHESQQLLRYETRDPRILEHLTALYNSTKYSLHWRWVRKRSGVEQDEDVVVVWITGHDSTKRCYRVGRHSIQEIDVATRKKHTRDESYTLFDWLRQTAQKLGHVTPMWIYETDPNEHVDEYYSDDGTAATETSWQYEESGDQEDERFWNKETNTKETEGEMYYDEGSPGLRYSSSTFIAPSRPQYYYSRTIEKSKKDDWWPLHRFLRDLCAESLQTQRLPLVVCITDNNDVVEKMNTSSSVNSQQDVVGDHMRGRLVWCLVHRARPGYEEMVRELRRQLYSTATAETEAAAVDTCEAEESGTARDTEKVLVNNEIGAGHSSTTNSTLPAVATPRNNFVEVYSGTDDDTDDDDDDDDDKNRVSGIQDRENEETAEDEEEEQAQKFSQRSARLTEQERTMIQERLTQYLDFDDPWIQTGAERTDPENAECVQKLADVLRERINTQPDSGANQEELLRFAKRKLERLREQDISFVPDSFPTTRLACHGLSLEGFDTLSAPSPVSSPFDCFCAHWVATHPLLSETLRQKAWLYHDPSYVPRRAQSACFHGTPVGLPPTDETCSGSTSDTTAGAQHPTAIIHREEQENKLSEKDAKSTTTKTTDDDRETVENREQQSRENASDMYLLGTSILASVEDHCIENMIPQQRLTNAYLQHEKSFKTLHSDRSQFEKPKKKQQETLLSLFYLRRAGEWLCYWGERGYGFVPRVEPVP